MDIANDFRPKGHAKVEISLACDFWSAHFPTKKYWMEIDLDQPSLRVPWRLSPTEGDVTF